MKNTATSNVISNLNVRKNKVVKVRSISMKGKKGTVGAPRKSLHKPRGNKWTLQQMFKLNPNVSELTIRNRVSEEVEIGIIVTAGTQRKPGKSAGRPEQLYMLATVLAKKTIVPVTDDNSLGENVTNDMTLPVAGSVTV